MTVVLVEGTGDQRALPILVHRVRGGTRIRPINMRGKSNMVRRERGFEDTVRRQYALGERSFVVLMDGDVTSAPYQSLEEERRDMRRRARSLAQELQVSVRVCWAVLEMESWLIGGIRPGSTYCSLRQVGKMPANSETAPHDPKQWLEDHLVNQEYSPRTQECLAHRIDLREATKRNRSMVLFFNNLV